MLMRCVPKESSRASGRTTYSNRFRNDLCPAVLGGSFFNEKSGLRATGVPCHLIVREGGRSVEE
jgi:hypothetical protein